MMMSIATLNSTNQALQIGCFLWTTMCDYKFTYLLAKSVKFYKPSHITNHGDLTVSTQLARVSNALCEVQISGVESIFLTSFLLFLTTNHHVILIAVQKYKKKFKNISQFY